MQNNDVQEIVWQEITSQYLPEELPEDNQELYNLLPRLAQSSTKRLLFRINKEQINELKTVLQAARSDKSHPLIVSISKSSLIDWDKEPNWGVIQRLFELILQEIDLSTNQ